ncbi:hypothetical protein B9G55_18175 [Saccharibacillus sp. O16]|nr:hypothetical protein B9G55_18175 [Saccharibacillus sp. O16]
MEESTVNLMESEIFQVDRALESWRDSGFDLSTAVGELIDNSIEARANIVRISPYFGQDKSVNTIVFTDNGTGISPEVLAHTLKIGFSTRYNQRKGLGRFGVGMKVAALSQGRRIDIYTKPVNESSYYHAYLDLDEIVEGRQTHIIAESVETVPQQYLQYMTWKDNHEFENGTIIVWSKIDRLLNEGKYGNSIKETFSDLTKFIARTYRKYIDQGLIIEQESKIIEAHDPLFLIESDRVLKILGKNNFPADVLHSDTISIDKKDITVTVTLLPEVVRKNKGEGGYKGAAAKYKDLYLKDIDGYISIMRNNREIYYDVIPRMFPTRIENIDRFIGVEISFPADLDEYFQVRNVKRGASPVGKLKKEISEIINKPIREARKRITDVFSKSSADGRKTSISHLSAINAVLEAEKSALPGRAGMGMSELESEKIIEEILEDVGINKNDNSNLAQEYKKQLKESPISIVDGSWPGKEMFEVSHLNGRAVVRLNHRHQFIKDIYLPIKEVANGSASFEQADIEEIARKTEAAIDLLFMAYAKAENLHQNPEEAFGDLRSQWSYSCTTYVREMLKKL